MNATRTQAVYSALLLLECASEDDGRHPLVDAAIDALWAHQRDTGALFGDEDSDGEAACAERLVWTCVADCGDRRVARHLETTAKRLAKARAMLRGAL